MFFYLFQVGKFKESFLITDEKVSLKTRLSKAFLTRLNQRQCSNACKVLYDPSEVSLIEFFMFKSQQKNFVAYNDDAYNVIKRTVSEISSVFR